MWSANETAWTNQTVYLAQRTSLAWSANEAAGDLLLRFPPLVAFFLKTENENDILKLLLAKFSH